MGIAGFENGNEFFQGAVKGEMFFTEGEVGLDDLMIFLMISQEINGLIDG